MSRLCDQLMQIYASGDSMTVLKLLKSLIDAVEDFEGHTATSEQVSYLTDKVEELEPAVIANTAKHLYKHEISISYEGDTYRIEATKTMYDNNSSQHTDYTMDGYRIRGACGGFVYTEGSAPLPITSLSYVTTARHILVNSASTDGDIATTTLPSTATITDTVTQIF